LGAGFNVFTQVLRCAGRGRIWFGLALACVGIVPALAQVQQPNVIIAPTREAPHQTEEIENVTRDAESQRLLRPDRLVTYEDVLAHPDEIDLNFAFAQGQIQRGELRGAAATLERILLINPDLPRVRLLYAIVLYRLDNIDEAERELQAVRLFEMPVSLRADLDRYLEQIRLRRQRTRYSVTTSVNLQHDWNKNLSPATGVTLVGDLPANVTGHSQRKRDDSINSFARFDVSHDLGFQARHRLTGVISYYRGEQLHLSELDLQSLSAEIGGIYDASPVIVAPNLYRRRIMLANKFYTYSTGAELRALHQVTADAQVYLFGGAENQVYDRIAEDQSGPDRDGWLYITGGGINYILNPAMRLGFEADLLRKRAQRNYNSYDGASVALTHTWIFGDGTYLLSALTGEQDNYKEADPLISDLTRRDRIGRARLTYGVPMAVVFDPEGEIDWLRDLTFSVSAEAIRQTSTLPNYTYNNRRASVGLSKRWDF
jgi:hypothetical protein